MNLFLEHLAALPSLRSNLTLDVWRHPTSGTSVYRVTRTGSGSLRRPSTQSIEEAIETMVTLFPSKFAIVEIATKTLSTFALADMEAALRRLVEAGIPTCAVVSDSLRPDFVRHHLLIAAPEFAPTVADAIVFPSTGGIRRNLCCAFGYIMHLSKPFALRSSPANVMSSRGVSR
jgi:hypothetical protein